MSDAAFTDSTTPTASPAFTLRPGFGGSTKTMSPSCSWAWSVMPTLTVPSASRFTHSWDSVYRSSFGTFISLSLGCGSLGVHETTAVAHERRLHHLRRERLVAHLHSHGIARRGAARQARERDRARECRRESAARDLALATLGVDLLGSAQDPAALLQQE